MNQSEKETQFAYVTEAGLCLVLIVLAAMGIIPVALCIGLCLGSLGAMIWINREKPEDELTGEKL